MTSRRVPSPWHDDAVQADVRVKRLDYLGVHSPPPEPVVGGGGVVALFCNDKGAEAWACAGMTIDSTTGLNHLAGTMSVVATPPITMTFTTCRRSG
jgi:hypothetical protein